jgi:hypothetical protein
MTATVACRFAKPFLPQRRELLPTADGRAGAHYAPPVHSAKQGRSDEESEEGANLPTVRLAPTMAASGAGSSMIVAAASWTPGLANDGGRRQAYRY